MAVNRGKQFEEKIKEGFLKCEEVSIDRVNDQMSGYKGSANICDFISYKKPNLFYLECKAVHGNTLNLSSDITKNQWDGLLKKTAIDGIIAGYMIWFVDHDVTLFVGSQTLRVHRIDNKSLNINHLEDINHLKLKGRKKRVFFEYDIKDFLKRVGEIYG